MKKASKLLLNSGNHYVDLLQTWPPVSSFFSPCGLFRLLKSFTALTTCSFPEVSFFILSIHLVQGLPRGPASTTVSKTYLGLYTSLLNQGDSILGSFILFSFIEKATDSSSFNGISRGHSGMDRIKFYSERAFSLRNIPLRSCVLHMIRCDTWLLW